jgi:MFS transporter, AAHS family, 4-hydroxybenzoate transporter
VFLLGMFVFGSQTVLNGVVTVIYPTAIRTTGICWAIAVGRIGGASGPILTGLLLQSGVSPPQVLMLGAIPASLALVSALCLTLDGSMVQDEVQATAG